MDLKTVLTTNPQRGHRTVAVTSKVSKFTYNNNNNDRCVAVTLGTRRQSTSTTNKSNNQLNLIKPLKTAANSVNNLKDSIQMDSSTAVQNNNMIRNSCSNQQNSTVALKRALVDKVETRKFINEQRIKRKSENKSTEAQNKLEKDVVKRKLMELQKNTRNIVRNNVAMQRKRKQSTEILPIESDKICQPSKQPDAKQIIKTPPKQPDDEPIQIELINSSHKVKDQKSNKPIGILRRSAEIVPRKFSLDLNAFMAETKLNLLPLNTNRFEEEIDQSTDPNLDLNDNRKIDQIENSQDLLDLKTPVVQTPEDYKLQIPTTTLKCGGSANLSHRTNKKSNRTDKMSYWLKPTPAQVYPYNFIMAVRKKLESLTNPIVKPTADTPIARPRSAQISNKKMLNFRHHLQEAVETSSSGKIILEEAPISDQFEYKSDFTSENLDSIQSPNDKEPDATQSGATMDSNFSSITLVDLNNTTSADITSLVTDGHRKNGLSSTKLTRLDSEDAGDTSISSAIFSQEASPIKNKYSTEHILPLTTANLDSYKITSKSLQLHKDHSLQTSFVNTERGTCENLSGSSTKHDFNKTNILEMLEMFNKSLCQVIEVNQHLHKTLLTDPQRKVETDDRSYSNDFETSTAIKTESNERERLSSTKLTSKSKQSSRDLHSIKSEIVESGQLIAETTEQFSNRSIHSTARKETISDSPIAAVTAASVTELNNVTIGSDIFAVFNHSEVEVMSTVSSFCHVNRTSCSEESFNYSSIGMFDQLLNTENQKLEHLTVLMKMREKSLIDRTKGQIAWLELQKQKFKHQGLTGQITAVKKKQRALLLRLEKERAEIHKITKSNKKTYENLSSDTKLKRQLNNSTELTLLNRSIEKTTSCLIRSADDSLMTRKSNEALKGVELHGNYELEEMLRNRELELKKRRAHVEHLLQWHQRLDSEENAVLKMEKQLMSSATRTHQQPMRQRETLSSTNNSLDKIQQKQLNDIDRSLRLLQSVKDRHDDTATNDFVEVFGRKMNKLWRRLTGIAERKFEDDQLYRLDKRNIEEIYEEAKLIVLERFQTNGTEINDLLNKTNQSNETATIHCISESDEKPNEIVAAVPPLNLNFSPDPSQQDEQHSSNNDENMTEAEENGFYFADDKIEDDINESQEDKDLNITFIHNESAIITNIDDDDEDTNNNNDENLENDKIICDNVKAKEFQDNYLSDEFERISSSEDKTTTSISDDESNKLNLLNSNDSSSSSSESSSDGLVAESIVTSINTSPTTATTNKDLEQRLIDIDDSLKDVSDVFDRATVMVSPTHNTKDENKENTNSVNVVQQIVFELPIESGEDIDSPKTISSENALSSSGSTTEDGQQQDAVVDGEIANKMPDIISEAEVLRRQQLKIEKEIKQLEQTAAVPFVILREIPNKPPPPYVPPAHGSPMTTIFPSDDRIKEIVYRRTNELYHEIYSNNISTDEQKSNSADRPLELEAKAATPNADDAATTPPSIVDENITNIFERIILDICKEIVMELHFQIPILKNVEKYKHPLAFFNPPNRLLCIQSHVLKMVNKLLTNFNNSQAPAQNAAAPIAAYLACNKRKRDIVDEILVQEMIEDESRWTNFDVEEVEVIDSITQTVLNMVVLDDQVGAGALILNEDNNLSLQIK